ncbi:hypothetical protein ACVIHC_002915 [Bradyrhizobium diazoefficiens]
MKRVFAILAFLCVLGVGEYFVVSRFAIRHELLTLFDASRQRPISVEIAVRRDYETKANLGLWKLPLAIISNGNTVKATEYSFLANALAARGYLVASIQQDLPSDPPLMTHVGQQYVGRREVYIRCEANILFALGELKRRQENADYDHITLVGHSNGGDVSMYVAHQHPELVSKVITLDNLRVPFVLSDNLKILSFRSKDPHFLTDPARAADAGRGQGARHRHRPHRCAAHRDERSRARRGQGEDPGDARPLPARQRQQRARPGRYEKSDDHEPRRLLAGDALRQIKAAPGRPR